MNRFSTQFVRMMILVLSGMLAAPAVGTEQTPGDDRFPGEHWLRYTDVEQAGFDAAKLAQARDTWEALPSSAFMVVADGAVVVAWGEVERRFRQHSVRKSFLSALYGIYWDRGEIELNKTLADLGIDDEPHPLMETEKQARILDLLKSRSGVFVPAAYEGDNRGETPPRGSVGPGRHFVYSNWDFNTAGTILMQETGEDLFEAYDRHFARPLQMEDWRVSDGYYHYERDKSKYPAYPFRMSARDAARFGLLFARNGIWQGEPLLSEHWIRRSTSLYSIDDRRGGYGYGLYWWIPRDQELSRYGTYIAAGTGGQRIVVIPGLDMVIVNRANTFEGERTPHSELLNLIEQVLAARTGSAVSEPDLEPLVAEPDPRMTHAREDQLEEFAGDWSFPSRTLGLPPLTTVRITIGDGHLVAFTPVTGTSRLYLQNDGSFHVEDSYLNLHPVRDESGAFTGLAETRSILIAAILAAAGGQLEAVAPMLQVSGGREHTLLAAGEAITGLMTAEQLPAPEAVRQLSNRLQPGRLKAELSAVGQALQRADQAEPAGQVFEFINLMLPQRD